MANLGKRGQQVLDLMADGKLYEAADLAIATGMSEESTRQVLEGLARRMFASLHVDGRWSATGYDGKLRDPDGSWAGPMGGKA